MDLDADLADVLARLNAAAEPGRTVTWTTAHREWRARAAPLKALEAELASRWRPLRGSDFDRAVEQLVRLGFEGRLLAWAVLGRRRDRLLAQNVASLEALGAGNDAWPLIDGFGVLVAGRAWNAGLDLSAAVEGWARRPDGPWRRTALVCTVARNLPTHGGKGDAATALAICRLLRDDRDDLVVKGVSWALRSAIRANAGAVAGALAEGGWASRVVREVGVKLRTGRKAGRVAE